MKTRGWAIGVVVVIGLAAGVGAGELKVGDLATVNKDGAKICQGRTVLATLDKGARIKVYYIFKEGGYARVYFMMGGKGYWGDMSLKDLDPPSGGEAEKAPPKNPFVVDDKVVVIAREAKLRSGEQVLGTVPEGTVLTVKKVKDDWLQVTAEVKGKATEGWIHARDVDYPTLKDKEKAPPPKKDETKEKGKE